MSEDVEEPDYIDVLYGTDMYILADHEEKDAVEVEEDPIAEHESSNIQRVLATAIKDDD